MHTAQCSNILYFIFSTRRLIKVNKSKKKFLTKLYTTKHIITKHIKILYKYNIYYVASNSVFHQ